MNRTSSALNWMVALLAAIGLATAVTTIFVGSGNRELQRDVARRQQEVNQALQLQPLNNQLIQALASMSVQRNDPQLAKVLTDNGITVQFNTPAGAAPAAPAPTR